MGAVLKLFFSAYCIPLSDASIKPTYIQLLKIKKYILIFSRGQLDSTSTSRYYIQSCSEKLSHYTAVLDVE